MYSFPPNNPEIQRANASADVDEELNGLVSPGEPAGVDLKRSRRSARLTAAAGISHAILFLIAFLLLRIHRPGPGASDAELLDFYGDPSNQRWVLIASIYVIPFAGIAFIYFMVSLRMWMASTSVRRNAFLSNVQLVSGVIYLALIFVAGAAESVVALALRSTDSAIDPFLARVFPQYGSALVLVFAMRMAAMFVFTSSGLGRATGLLPKWFWVLGAPVGVLLLFTSSISPLVLVVFPLWVMAFSVLLALRSHQRRRETLPVDSSSEPSTAP